MGLPPTAVDTVNNNGEQNHCGQQEESDSAGDTKDSHREIIDEFERLPVFNEIESLPLFMAVLKGDLAEIHKKYFEALSSNITANWDTPLHVAIQARCSIPFIRQLVEILPVESLSRQSLTGLTALHDAAITGNAEAAKIMVHKNSTLPQIKNKFGDTPLYLAAKYGQEETVCFLLSVTPAPSPFDGQAEAKLLNCLISAGFYGYAFDVIKEHPETEPYFVKDGEATTYREKFVNPNPLIILAQKPEAFESKSQFGLCQRILHYVFQGNSAHTSTDTPESRDEESRAQSFGTRESERSTYRKGTYSQRLKKEIQAVDLLNLLIEEVMMHRSDARKLLSHPLGTAARVGNHVFIKTIFQAYPRLVFSYDEDFHSVFHDSVIHRQEDVFSILFQFHAFKHLIFGLKDRSGNNMLHLAGMCKRPSKISGAALQMQRELQWFKEVEKIVPPLCKEEKNHEGKTPREVFTEKHQDLVKDGEEWMKNVASSCSVVAALFVTVLFAAAITGPGGNDDKGGPQFLDDTKFLIFSVSVSLGFFSSSISLLMFLGMLTSRYAEDDFLEKLPRRLAIGLVTLFFSLAAMLVAFSVSIHIVLFRRIRCIWIPVYLIVVMFGFMQSRLLYEIVKHTYVTPIFHKKPTERIF